MGRYQLQAAIAALHAEAGGSAATDWPQIAALYGELAQVQPSPVVQLNGAVAIGMSEGPERGLALIEQLGTSGSSIDITFSTPPRRHAAPAQFFRGCRRSVSPGTRVDGERRRARLLERRLADL